VGRRCSDLKDILEVVPTVEIHVERGRAKGFGGERNQV